jgi:glucose/arabinose dehydrogenase
MPRPTLDAPLAPALAATAIALASATAAAQNITAEHLATGLGQLGFVASPPGDTNRLFILETRSREDPSVGLIKVMHLDTGEINQDPFLAVPDLSGGFEAGLLGLAFAPDYATSGVFFINYTAAAGNGQTRVVKYRQSLVNPDVANPLSAVLVLAQDQPFDDHNAGWMAFGPDGYLYISLGDGGGGGDPFGNAQSLTTLLGKIIRINIVTNPYSIPPTNPFFAQPQYRREIWAYGLRNPWRPSFDRATGDLWIADVGQGAREEIDYQPAATTPPFEARNYGWDCREGDEPYEPENCAPGTLMTPPVYAYPHSPEGGSITGGYVYRGCKVPEARGHYFFADFIQGSISSFRLVDGQVTELTDRTAQLTPRGEPAPSMITSFGEDAGGELYFVTYTGDLYRMAPACWANCDNSTQQPALNVLDFNCFLNRFTADDCWANCDGSTQEPRLNVLDFNCFLNRFTAGCQ